MTNHTDIIISFEGPTTVVPQKDKLIEILDKYGSWYEITELTSVCFYIDYRGYFQDEIRSEIEDIDLVQILIKDETHYIFT
jgi:hypothetical protein